MKKKELQNLSLHLLGQDPVSLLEFHPHLPMTDANWERANDEVFTTLGCPRTVSSVPKEDIKQILSSSPCPLTSILSLKYILKETDYSNPKWDNPLNPPLGKDKIEPTYNLALRIIQTLAKNNLIWAAALPEVRASDTWKWFKDLPQEDINSLTKDLTPKLVSPDKITLLLKGKEKQLSPIPDFQAEVLIYEDIGLEIFKTKYFLRDIPFVCTLVGEDETYGCVSYKGPVIIANSSYLKLLEDQPKKAQELYNTASEDLFFHRSQDYDQDLYDIDNFRADFPDNIHLLANPSLAIKTNIKKAEDTISQVIANLTKAVLPMISEEIQDTCQQTKGLKVNYVKWDPKNGLSIKVKFSSKTTNKTIEIKSGSAKIISSPEAQ